MLSERSLGLSRDQKHLKSEDESGRSGKLLLPFARKRQDNRLGPAEVLGWVTNTLLTPEKLHRIFMRRASNGT